MGRALKPRLSTAAKKSCRALIPISVICSMKRWKQKASVSSVVPVFEKVEKQSDGELKVSLTNGETLNVGQVMMAIGRKPNTKGLGLEKAGVLKPTRRVLSKSTTIRAPVFPIFGPSVTLSIAFS
ncbi:pyridine nucleotide-disulfide oxidoreductase domain-containing protein [Ditylenchus destructor]|nr:pyridine nucleotide-disulfide oxidoreductase domain-containing protein [Ditylenchus destructor]